MEKHSLNVKHREEKNPRELRRQGQIPATLYGPAFPSENLQFCAREFSRLPAAAYSHLLDLKFENGKPATVIIRSVQRESTTDTPLHVEFYRVSLDKKLTVTVPIQFVGTAPAVVAGAQFFEVSPTVDIECLPGDIPEFVEADISTLEEFDSVLHFRDLKVGEEVKILNPEDGVVAKAASPKTQAAGGAEGEGGETASETGSESNEG
ncbi:MAG: 50S ribosomal protein L25 [Candidatus Obscuribacterales bacterium]